MANTKNSKKLGPRVTVLFSAASSTGKGNTKNKTKYVYMRKATADYFGFKAVPDAQVKTKNNRNMAVRGSFGAGSITFYNRSGEKTKSIKIPVPAGATISQIKQFLQKASKNKPDSFSSVNGRSYPVTTNARN